MSTTEVDRALREDRAITPSPDFTGRVMRAVRQRVDEREALAFPWWRLAPGLVLCGAILAIGLAAGATPVRVDAVVEVLDRYALTQAAMWIPSLLVGSYAIVWLSMRLAAPRL